MSNNRQRYEISICFQDRGGTKRYVNGVGSLWFDGTKGNIDLPPGVALVGGHPDVYINVGPPYDRSQGGGQQRRGQGGGQGRGRQQQQRGGGGGGWDGPPPGDEDDIPY